MYWCCFGIKSIYPINRPDITLIEEKAQNSAAPIKWYHVGKGIKSDFLGRLPYYLDDFLDGIRGPNTIQKTIATTLFLYFSVILPAVALGVLNSKNTKGKISVEQGINWVYGTYLEVARYGCKISVFMTVHSVLKIPWI